MLKRKDSFALEVLFIDGSEFFTSKKHTDSESDKLIISAHIAD